jgi:uncharacterized membrane protein YeaQ/YmgE (transglycosylase-associated protein family)
MSIGLIFGIPIFSTIIVGLIIGIIAKVIMPGKDPGGIIVTVLIGISGSLLGNFAGSIFLSGNTMSGFMGWVMSVLGAISILVIYRLLTAQRLSGN